MEGFIDIDFPNTSKVEAKVYNNVDDLLISIINDSVTYIGTPVALMSREQKIADIRYIDTRGGFKIKNAGNTVAKYYDISKYTVYNYLGQTDA